MGVEEGSVDNSVIDVGGVVEGGSVGLGLVAVVVDGDGLCHCNGLLQWRCNHLG